MMTPPDGLLLGEPDDEIGLHITSSNAGYEDDLWPFDYFIRRSANRLTQLGYSDQARFAIHFAIIELYKNAWEHTEPVDGVRSILIIAYYAADWVVIGCRDQGHFFKNPDVQHQLEARTVWPSSGSLPFDGEGFRFLTKASSGIVIDTTTNTFWCRLERSVVAVCKLLS